MCMLLAAVMLNVKYPATTKNQASGVVCVFIAVDLLNGLTVIGLTVILYRLFLATLIIRVGSTCYEN